LRWTVMGLVDPSHNPTPPKSKKEAKR